MDHEWEDRPLESEGMTRIDMGTEMELDGRQVRFVNLYTKTMIDAYSYRVCKLCSQESIDMKNPPMNDCGLAQVVGIMEL